MINENYYEAFDRKENLHFDSKVVHGAPGLRPHHRSGEAFPSSRRPPSATGGLGYPPAMTTPGCSTPPGRSWSAPWPSWRADWRALPSPAGQAANMALFTWLPCGSHVLLSDDIYGGTFRICDEIFSKFGCTFDYVDMGDLEAVKAAIRPETRMFFVETPTNPMMHVADIAALAELAHSRGALMVVDNTFLTPYFQRPLELGADVVVHSAHQVPVRPQRRGGRHRRGEEPGDGRLLPRPAEIPRQRPCPLRLLAHSPGAENPLPADAAAQRKRQAGGPVAAEAPQGQAGLLCGL